MVLIIGWGLSTAPFDWNIDFLPRDPVSVDAIPNIGENQQIVFTKWPGRSPQDIDDQITYPLTTALLGTPGVKTIRSNSFFGFSSIYIIFNEDVEFYWSRSRILEKLNALPASLLPEDVQPVLGPDATALGQIFWYTLEGRDPSGNVTGGWDLHELRSIQDFSVKYGLASVAGVSEVASIGGYVKEYQIDVDPAALRNYGITLDQVIRTVKNSNLDVGARTVEINRVEYLVRGLGYIKNLSDLEESVVTVKNNSPLKIKDIARVTYGPAERRGLLDKSGAEVVGGVVVSRFDANPMEVIKQVKAKIAEITPGLPSKTLNDGTKSQLTIVPFYDRSQLIQESLGTLEQAIKLEILITILVVIVMVVNLRASIVIAGLLPIVVLFTFICMRYFGVEANIVALSGIAIAIGTIVDVGIVFSENMIKKLEGNDDTPLLNKIYEASSEVSKPVLTAILTTIVSFIPVFTLEAAEGKLFQPLAFTKTFALIGALFVTFLIVPTVSYWLYSIKIDKKSYRLVLNIALALSGLFVMIFWSQYLAGVILLILSSINIAEHFLTESSWYQKSRFAIIVLAIGYFLTDQWLPLGPSQAFASNFLFVFILGGGFLLLTWLITRFYSEILTWCLNNRALFLSIPAFFILVAANIWFGFPQVFSPVSYSLDVIGVNVRTTSTWSRLAHAFPGIGSEFMPSLDEGSFLLMPTSMPHAGIEENKRVLQMLDMAVSNIPEVEMVVGKAGRVESALDPAPISMYENMIQYKSKYKTDQSGRRIRFAITDGEYDRNENGDLIPDEDGEFYRQWRDHIQSPDDIWDEIISVVNFPGVTSAPKLQPIETRLVMLQTGMRAPMGIKIKGPDLATIEGFGLQLEQHLKAVPAIKSQSVFADRIVGKPYLQINIDREAIARFGLTIMDVQRQIEVGLGGMILSTSVEGRERYPIRVRYPRELRDNPDDIENLLIPTSEGAQIPLSSVAKIDYVKGPQMIKSEDTFLIGYVIFDRNQEVSEVKVVEQAIDYLNGKIESGELQIPAGVSYTFTGSYENQVRAAKRLSIVVPLALIAIFLLLYLQFRSVSTTLMIFSGIAVAFSGGFLMLWLYGQGWFMDFEFLGTHMRSLFQMDTINLSVAVWVGFIALFGIATDDGVLMGSYLTQIFKEENPNSKELVRASVLKAGLKRVRPCMMTTATTVIALLPILTSTGRGADLMIPMAIPSIGGMLLEIITLFVVPVLFAIYQEQKLKKS